MWPAATALFCGRCAWGPTTVPRGWRLWRAWPRVNAWRKTRCVPAWPARWPHLEARKEQAMTSPNPLQNPAPDAALGLSGRLAAAFQANALTPLLALVALLLGLFAVLVTPREEEPQINVTMANVIIPFPGASSADVEKMVAAPAEHVLSQIQCSE